MTSSLTHSEYSFWKGARGQIDFIAYSLDPEAWTRGADEHISYAVWAKITHLSSGIGHQILNRRARSFDMAIKTLHAIETYYAAHVCLHPVYHPIFNVKSAGASLIPGPRCPLCNRQEAYVQDSSGQVLRYVPPKS